MNVYGKTALFILLTIEVFSVLPPSRSRGSHPNYVRGVIHVHSTFSDGGGTPTEIVAEADEAGLDFVVLTDHNSTAAREFEGRSGNTDLFVESESSTLAGHALSFSSLSGARNTPDSELAALAYQHFLGSEGSPNGFFIALAHPSNIKNPWSRLDRFSDGYEVVNFDSSWQRSLSDSVLNFLMTLSLYPINNYLSALKFFDVYEKDLVAWDAMNSTPGNHFGILAHDTHAKLKLKSDWWWKWPDYTTTFKLASNVVFLKGLPPESFADRKQAIYDSLRNGRLAIAFDGILPFQGNSWTAQCGESSAGSGEEIRFQNGCEFKVELPNGPFKYVLKLKKNGELVHTVNTREPVAMLPLDGPGIYRLEVWVKACL